MKNRKYKKRKIEEILKKNQNNEDKTSEIRSEKKII